MQKLKAINAILPKLGEHPVTSIDSRNPTLGVILPQIDLEIDQVLMSGWWFNTFDVELFPNSEGEIAVPDDTLSFISNPGEPELVQRGDRFYNMATRTYEFPVGRGIHGKLRQRMDFEELPESVAQYVLYSALVTIYITDIGLEQVVQQWASYATQAGAAMEQEHLRHKKYTIKNSRRYRNLRNAMRG